MGFKLDYRQLKAYVTATTAFEDDFNKFLRNLLIEMAERVLSRAKKRTPVDTGALRNAWQLGNIQGSGKNITVEILNGMEYASDVEYGHRIVAGGTEVGWKDGVFMLTVSITEIDRQIPARFAKAFAQFCKEHNIADQ